MSNQNNQFLDYQGLQVYNEEINKKFLRQYEIINEGICLSRAVPESVAPYAEVTKIGGMSYKTKNLLKPYAVGSSSWNGYTITRNADGSTAVTGAATEAKEMLIDIVDVINYPVYMGAGETYTLTVTKDGVPVDIGERVDYKDEAGSTYWGWPGDTSRARALTKLYLQKSVSAGDNTSLNGVYRAILTKGNTVVPFEPYFDGLRDSKVTEIKSVGANLIPFPYSQNSKTQNGITWTVNADGSVTANGTATGVSEFEFITRKDKIHLEEKTYTFSGCPAGGSDTTYKLYLQDPDSGFAFVSTGEAVTKQALRRNYMCWARIYAGTTVTNLTFRPMLNEGDIALPFSQFRSTLSIPEAAQVLNGYGLGINADYYNYINWNPENNIKTWNILVKKKVFNGSENWSRSNYFTAGNGYTLQDAYLPDYKANTLQGVCSHFDTRNSSATLTSGIVFGSRLNIVTPADMGLTDSTLFKAYIKEQYDAGTPVTVVYVIGNPEVIDISDLLTSTNMIDVESNGILTFVNEYDNAILNEVKYYNVNYYNIAGNLLGVAEKARCDENGNNIAAAIEKISDGEVVAELGLNYESPEWKKCMTDSGYEMPGYYAVYPSYWEQGWFITKEMYEKIKNAKTVKFTPWEGHPSLYNDYGSMYYSVMLPLAITGRLWEADDLLYPSFLGNEILTPLEFFHGKNPENENEGYFLVVSDNFYNEWVLPAINDGPGGMFTLTFYK